jgi:proteasome lid subunit RPN8/RPN11
MTAATVLKLSPEIAERIRKHGAETYPHECCGALLGGDADAAGQGEQTPPRDVLDLFPLVNRRDDSPRNRFSVTSEDVLAAEKAARALGIDVVGWYHSHPDHPAEPSQYDRDHAWPWYSYIIVSVANGQPQRMTSWRLNDDRASFTSEDLEIGQRATV